MGLRVKQGEFEEARTVLGLALATYSQLGRPSGVVDACTNLGVVAGMEADAVKRERGLVAARPLFEQAYAFHERAAQANEQTETAVEPDRTRGQRKVFQGKVVSTKMAKTITVECSYLRKHPKYGKYIKSYTKLKAHDEEQKAKEGDVVEVRDRSKQLAIVLEAAGLPERDVPDYLDVDHSKMTATFVRTPGLTDVPYPVMMEPNLVIEYYAQN